METNQITEYINKFLVDYFRISERNGIAYTGEIRYINKTLLQHCLYLERCIIQDINRTFASWYDYEEIIKELQKFIESETDNGNGQTEICLSRWFPSLVEEESSFFTFAEIMWIAQHYFAPEERGIFEKLILPIWVKSYYVDYEVSNTELQDRIRNFASVEKTLTDLEVRDWLIVYFTKLNEKYYVNLYTRKRDYYQRDKIIGNLQQEFKECMFNLFMPTRENVNKDEETK